MDWVTKSTPGTWALHREGHVHPTPGTELSALFVAAYTPYPVHIVADAQATVNKAMAIIRGAPYRGGTGDISLSDAMATSGSSSFT